MTASLPSLLANVASRTRVGSSTDPGPFGATWYLGRHCDELHALAYRPQWPGDRAEVHLAASLWRRGAFPPRFFDEGGAFWTLSRREEATDLVPADGAGGLFLEIEIPGGKLRVDNAEGTRARATDTTRVSTGRIGRCDPVVGDEAIRETLARALRVRVCRDETATRGCIDPVARIFAVGSRQHRIEVGSAEEGAESFSLLVTSSGVREEADVSLGPAPSLSLPALVAFVPPRPPGTLVRPGDPGLAVMRYEPGKEPALVGASRVDLGALRGSR